MLCEDCHERARHYDNQHRRQLGEECEAPIGNGIDVKLVEDFHLMQVRSAARALLKDKTVKKIPEKRVRELTTLVKDHYKIEELTDDALAQGADCDIM